MGYIICVSVLLNLILGILINKSIKDYNEFNDDLEHLTRVNERLAARLKGIGIDVSSYYKMF